MNTEYLRYMVTINEYKSISKAAKELFVSQSTLSRIVQNIENNIGITIFNRTNRGVTVTSEGEMFLNRAKSMIAELDKFENDYFQALYAPDQGNTLLIGAHRSTPAVEAFIEYYNTRCKDSKNLNLLFHEEPLDDIIEKVVCGNLDLGIIHYISSKEDELLRRCNALNLSCVILKTTPFCLQVRDGHPFSTRESIDLDELKPYVQVCFSDEDFTGINYCTSDERVTWNVDRRRVVTNSRGVLRTIVMNTDCYYIGNNWRCKLLDSENIVCVPIGSYPYTIKTAYIFHKNRELSKEERIYISILKDIIR